MKIWGGNSLEKNLKFFFIYDRCHHVSVSCDSLTLLEVTIYFMIYISVDRFLQYKQDREGG